MRRFFNLISIPMAILFALGFGAVQADQHVTVNCAEIENAQERLTCFDQQFPSNRRPAPIAAPQRRTTPPPTVPSEVDRVAEPAVPDAVNVPSSPASRTVATDAVDDVRDRAREPVREEQREPPSSASEPTASKSDFGRPTGFLGKSEQRSLESRLKEVRSQKGQKMMFLLENKQVWMQTSPRQLPIREGERITISRALVGGYVLETENGTTTRVVRIDDQS